MAESRDKSGFSSYVDEVHGNKAEYAILKSLFHEKTDQHGQRTAELRQVERALSDVTVGYRAVHDRLATLKAGARTDDERRMFDDLEPFCEAAAPEAVSGSIQFPLQPCCKQSLTEMVLLAAEKASNLEHRQEMLQTMLAEKSKLVQKLDSQLRDNKRTFEQKEMHIADLTSIIAKLQLDLSLKPSTMNQQIAAAAVESEHFETTTSGDEFGAAGGGHLEEFGDDTTMDPFVLHEKIRHLRRRISELMNHNEQWNKVCESLTRQVEEANATLRELEKTLQQEKEKTNIAQTERDKALAEAERQRELKQQSDQVCRQLTEQVVHLEATVRELEGQLVATTQQHEMLAQLQLETYREDIEEERTRLRTIADAQAQSLNQQWRTLRDQLQLKQLKLDQVLRDRDQLKAENRKLEQLLEQARVDKSLIQEFMKASSPGERSCDPFGHQATTVEKLPISEVSTTRPPPPQQYHELRRGKLEEDSAATATAAPVGRNHHSARDSRRNAKAKEGSSSSSGAWACAACTFINSDGRATKCEVCLTRRGTESRIFYQNSNKYHQESRSEQVQAVKRGTLVEDGVTSTSAALHHSRLVFVNY